MNAIRWGILDMYFDRREEVTETLEYLYVTTYQGDNYKFYKEEVSFDIYEKLGELNEL